MELSEELRRVREDVGSGRVVEAAEAVRRLKAALRVDDDVGAAAGEPVMYGVLRKEWSECFEEVCMN